LKIRHSAQRAVKNSLLLVSNFVIVKLISMKNLLLCGSLLFAGSAFSQVLSEDFEGLSGGLPAGWVSASTTSGAGDFYTGDAAAANAGGYWPVPATNDFAQANDDVCNCNMSNVTLTTPSMNFTGLSGVSVSYDFVDDLTYGGNPHQVAVSTDGGTTWSTIYTMAAGAASINWQSNLVPLGAATNNASNVKVRWTYNDAGAWATGLAIDNVEVFEPFANDAQLIAANIARYALMGSNTNLEVDVLNFGTNTINNVTIDWNDGVSHSSTINVTIAPGATVTVTHPTPVNYPNAVEANINVTITAINGGADDDMSNNSGAALHNTVSELVNKNVVIEEGTGTWCGWCPRGAVAMEYMYDNYPTQFIGIAVHNGDPMTVTEYDNGANISGFPGCNVDRILLDQSVSSTAFETYYNDRVGTVVPAQLGIAVSGTGNSATIVGTATFKTPISSANYRLGVVIMEDNVTGTTSQYNQANYYSYASNNLPLTGAGHDWQQEPNPVPAADMVYDHVGRALLGTYAGQSGSVPATVVDGTVASYTFNYTVPGTSNRDNMAAVLMLLDAATGEIVHATKASIAAAGIPSQDMVNMNVYPNPASDFVTVDFEAHNADYTVSITDLSGRVVASESYGNLNGSQSVNLSLAGLNSGNYLVAISTQGASYNQMITVK
jgi:hypothetical protein